MFRSLPKRALVWAPLIAVLLTPNAFAAGDDAHKGEIAIESWSFDARQASGGGAGKVSYSDLSVMISLEKAAPVLQLAVATGKQIPTMEIRSGRAGDDKRQDYLTITLEEVMVSSYQTSGGKARVTMRAARAVPGTGKTMAAEVMASSHPGGANFAFGDGSVRF